MLRRVHVLRTIVTAARRLRATVRSAAVVAVALVQVPVFILRNQAIFQNELVYPFWIWSFGHTTLGIDFASRLYYPARISLVFVPHPRSNSFVPLCFDHNVDVFVYRPVLDDSRGAGERARFEILRFWLLLLSGVTNRFTVVDRSAVYQTLSLADGGLLGSDRDGTRIEPASDITGYVRLLRDGTGRAPALPAELADSCRRRIEERHPSFFARPFVTLALREKGRDEPFDSAVRCCGPQENYRPAVRFLTENGYHVIGAAETRDEIFTDLPGYFGLGDVGLPRELVDIFSLTKCALLVGQISGPICLANTTGVPCVVSDTMPYRFGTFAPDDILVFKNLRVAATGRPLSLVEIYVDRPELAYGVGLAESGVLIEPSTPEEILAGVEEVVARVEGRLQLTQEDEALIERFREIVPAQMLLSYLGNRPSLSALRAVRSELLGGPPPLGRSSRA